MKFADVLIKFADGSVTVRLLKDNETCHGPVVSEFLLWCNDSSLKLNVLKTKEVALPPTLLPHT